MPLSIGNVTSLSWFLTISSGENYQFIIPTNDIRSLCNANN